MMMKLSWAQWQSQWQWQSQSSPSKSPSSRDDDDADADDDDDDPGGRPEGDPSDNSSSSSVPRHRRGHAGTGYRRGEQRRGSSLPPPPWPTSPSVDADRPLWWDVSIIRILLWVSSSSFIHYCSFSTRKSPGGRGTVSSEAKGRGSSLMSIRLPFICQSVFNPSSVLLSLAPISIRHPIRRRLEKHFL